MADTHNTPEVVGPEQNFQVVDQENFHLTIEKATNFSEMIEKADGLSTEEKDELRDHIDQIAASQLGLQ